MKRCSRCRGLKPATEEFFSRRAASLDGLKYTCKICDANKKRARGRYKVHEADDEAGIPALITVTVYCRNKDEGCRNHRKVTIEEGCKPPVYICSTCQNSGSHDFRTWDLGGLKEAFKRCDTRTPQQRKSDFSSGLYVTDSHRLQSDWGV